MNSKKALCAALAGLMTFSLCACGKDDEQSSHIDEIQVTDKGAIETEDGTFEIAALGDDVEKNLNWLSYYDLNPGIGKEKSTELVLFESKGGSITYQQTTYATKYTDLATRIIGDRDQPDIFKYEQKMTFPYQVLKGMYQPIDSIVDFSSPLWKDVAEAAETFVLDGEHYVAPISFDAMTLMVYDKENIEVEGLADPYELYLNGEWNWNAWKDIMLQWVAQTPADEDSVRFGVNGWFQPTLINTTGKTMFTIDENGDFASNIYDPDIERAVSFLYDLGKNNLVDDTWYGDAPACFNANKSLFYVMGPWAMTTTHGPKEDDEWAIVPVPKDPNVEENYTTSDMMAYMWVSGSTKSEAVKCWIECCKATVSDPDYAEIAKQKFFVTTPYWTEEMYDVKVALQSYTHLFDVGYGATPTLGDDDNYPDGSQKAVTARLYEYVNKINEETETQYTWAQLRSEYESVIEKEIIDLNAMIDEFTANNN